MSESARASSEAGLEQSMPKGRVEGMLQVGLVVGVLAAGLVANVVLTGASTPPQVKASGPATVAVSIVKPEIGDTRIRLRETGSLQVRNSIQLSPQVSGRVVWVNPALASGGTFRKGEVLFRLDDADYRASIERTGADLAARQADLRVEQSEADIAKREWALVNPGEPVPPIVAREPQLARAEAAVRSAQAALADAQRNLSRVNFTLPFDGRVQSTAVEVGQNLIAGQSYGRAYEAGGIEVSVPVNPTVLQGLAPAAGRTATVRPRQPLLFQDDVAYAAEVTREYAELDPQTRLARLILEFREPTPLLPGDFVDVEIAGPTLPGTYRFPDRALHENRSVWVVKDGRLSARKPQLLFVDSGVISAMPFDFGEGIVVSSLNNPQEGGGVVVAGEQPGNGARP